LKKHCGCGTGRRWTWGDWQKRNKKNTIDFKTAEGKRLARIMALPGYKAPRHDAHVNEWKLLLAARRKRKAVFVPMSEAEKVEKRRTSDNAATANLANRYIVRRLKKNMPALKGVKLPQELIDLERLRLMIKREVKQLRSTP
jgi:hypothetical protein